MESQAADLFEAVGRCIPLSVIECALREQLLNCLCSLAEAAILSIGERGFDRSRQNPNFPQPFQPDFPCPALPIKIFSFRFPEIHVSLRASCFHQRGGSRSSRTSETGCGGREDVERA